MRLDHRLHGRGVAPLLVLANSLGTRQQLWGRQLPELTERFRVLTYDHPGHGASALPTEPCTVEAFAHGLLRLLDELALERVSVCGTSLGGMVGMSLALEAPERVERLVLSCTSAYLGPPDGWTERARAVRAEGMAAIADAVVVRWFTSDLAREQPETVARFRAMLVGTPPEGYARCCEALAAWDARERIAAISVPTLVIAGAEDPATPVEHARFLASRIPDARLLVLERAAHLANVERAEEFTNVVLGLSRRGGAGVSDEGMKTRREVLGDEHVDRAVANTTDLTADFQDFITRYAWGEIWSRPGLDRRTRSCITITASVATGREHELAMHVRAALRNGVTPDELKEILLQCAIYCGVPAANGAFAIAQRVLDEEGTA